MATLMQEAPFATGLEQQRESLGHQVGSHRAAALSALPLGTNPSALGSHGFGRELAHSSAVLVSGAVSAANTRARAHSALVAQGTTLCCSLRQTAPAEEVEVFDGDR